MWNINECIFFVFTFCPHYIRLSCFFILSALNLLREFLLERIKLYFNFIPEILTQSVFVQYLCHPVHHTLSHTQTHTVKHICTQIINFDVVTSSRVVSVRGDQSHPESR